MTFFFTEKLFVYSKNSMLKTCFFFKRHTKLKTCQHVTTKIFFLKRWRGLVRVILKYYISLSGNIVFYLRSFTSFLSVSNNPSAPSRSAFSISTSCRYHFLINYCNPAYRILGRVKGEPLKGLYTLF